MDIEQRLIINPGGIERFYALLNYAIFKTILQDGGGEVKVFMRITYNSGAEGEDPRPSDYNCIGYGIVSLQTGEFSYFIPDLLKPEDIDAVSLGFPGKVIAIEDPRYDKYNNWLIVNVIFLINGVKVSCPMVFSLDGLETGKKPELVGWNLDLLGSKVITFLDRDHLLTRPSEPFRMGSRPTVMKYCYRPAGRNVIDVISSPEVFFRPAPDMEVGGLGTPKARWDDDHDLLLVHEARVIDDLHKPYHHHYALTNNKTHEIVAISAEMFLYEEYDKYGDPEKDWFKLSTYVCALDEIGNDFLTIVTPGDMRSIIQSSNRAAIAETFCYVADHYPFHC